MGKFLLPPDGREPIGNFLHGRRFQISEPVLFQSLLIYVDDGQPKRVGSIMVDAGTVTDFASVPRFFWRIISPFDDDVRLPSLIHDDMYDRQYWPKEVADLVFREALIAHGAPAWKVTAMYQVVNWFGKAAWNKHKAEKLRLEQQHDMIASPGKN